MSLIPTTGESEHSDIEDQSSLVNQDQIGGLLAIESTGQRELAFVKA